MGIVVLELISDGDNVDVIRYRVRRTCCGTELEMSHRGVGAKRSSRCRRCYHSSPPINGVLSPGRRGVILAAEMARPPKPKITSADIERHLARVFR